VVIFSWKLVRFDKNAFLPQIRFAQESLRIGSNRLMTDQVLDRGIVKIPIRIDGLAELTETGTQNYAEKRVSRAWNRTPARLLWVAIRPDAAGLGHHLGEASAP
jgi:hypothetical protein